MLDVFISVDVEVWCDGWRTLDQKFPEAFKRYVYGPTPRGEFGLPHQVKVLNAHGLTGVFFVESLFTCRFGEQPLAEIVGLLNQGRQEVQLHLHTEWVDEALEPLLPNVSSKRQHLRCFDLEDQRVLIGEGLKRLARAGGAQVNAFRAGSFGFNRDTLKALAGFGIPFDSSYNALLFGQDSGVAPGVTLIDPIECEGVIEYPMSVYDEGGGRLRHVQLTACSYSEMEGLLWSALHAGHRHMMILSHNFELLAPSKTRADPVVVGRFEKLCAFLDRHRDCFRLRGFRDLDRHVGAELHEPLRSPRWKTGARMLSQGFRRIYT
jgi:hypothetical protein